MIAPKIITCLLCIILLMPTALRSQDPAVLMKEAQQFEAVAKEKEALQKYLDVLRLQPGHLAALCKASELYNSLGKRQTTRASQKEYYRTAKSYAQKALQVNPNSVDANFAMSLAMGRMALISSGEEKINAVKDIRTYAEKTIKLDPNSFKGYHVLGKWHYEVSNLNSLEKWLVKVTYGGLPKASLEEAMDCFEKSRQLNPGFLLNYLELARCYERKDEDKKAIALLETMMKMPNSHVDDPTVKKQGQELLDELR